MAKLDEIISPAQLENPIPLDAHWTSYGKFVRATVPATCAGIVCFALAILCGTQKWPLELTGIFALGGSFFLFLNVYAVFVFEDERQDKQWRRNVYTQQLTLIQIAISNLTVIQKVGTLHMGATNAPPQTTAPASHPQLLYPEVDAEINGIYQVAQTILHLALSAWRDNNNARPKLKPFSFDATVKVIDCGHVRWKAALEWLEDAKILNNATVSNWSPLLTDENAAHRLLDALLIQRGYYKHMHNNQPEWRKAVPQ